MLIQRFTKGQQPGFTYIALLILLAIIALASTATVTVGKVMSRRSAETELLRIGDEYRAALISYANSTPAGQQITPRKLEDLLRDPRYPEPRRHLRKIYVDPITGKAEWHLIMLQTGNGIIGITSTSTNRPIKISNFSSPYESFAGAQSYMEWRFMRAPDIR